jgi:hypothetical protein
VIRTVIAERIALIRAGLVAFGYPPGLRQRSE